MKLPLMVGICLGLLLLAQAAWADWQGKIVEVYGGGDILTIVADDNRKITLRLYGIDCPEPGQPYGQLAEDKVRELVVKPQKSIIVLEEKRDSTGQVLATLVLHDGTTLNARLLLAGLAWVYPINCVDAQYCQEMIKLQTKAQQNRNGLWADDSPIAPWEWRKQHK